MKLAKKTDIIIIALIILFGIAFWFLYNNIFSTKGAVAEIYCKSELVRTVDLTEGKEYSFSIPEEPDVVFTVYADGSIAFTESDCPDKVCINTGRLYRTGQIAACLPNQIYIKIVNPDESEAPDLIIG
ncbi:MAG: hypothetical protein A2Y17_10805 [Clostridiales bacterium GWF2_38_85]|nr:MAG: hypothetical protein A2Y17_10805 [Clostridiales bacterium GWF2_38_85]HBL84616.1 hypothetical protein [Clostridiales bacterium]